MSCLCCAGWTLEIDWEYRFVVGSHEGYYDEESPGAVYTTFRTREPGAPGFTLVKEWRYVPPLTSIDGTPSGGLVLEDEFVVASSNPDPPAGGYGPTTDISEFAAEVREALSGKAWQTEIPPGQPFVIMPGGGTFSRPLRSPYTLPEGNGAYCNVLTPGTAVFAGQARFRVRKRGHYTPLRLSYSVTGQDPVDELMAKADTETDWVEFEVPENNVGGEFTTHSAITLVTPFWT